MFNRISRQLERLLAANKRRKDRKELMVRAVDAVVAGTDPRIRAVGGYRKKLRPAIKTSIQYVQDAVDRIPGPFTLAASHYGSDPTIHACFSSVDDLQSLLAQSKEVQQLFREARGGQAQWVYAFMAMQRREKIVFAPAIVDDRLRQDVAQTLVSYANRRIIAPADSGHRARRQLMRSAFLDLTASAMEAIGKLQRRSGARVVGAEIERTRLQVLRGKREGLQDLITGGDGHDREIASLEQGLSDRPQDVGERPHKLTTLEDYLDQVVEVFSNPEKHLSLELSSIYLSRMNRKLPPGAQDDLNEIRMADSGNSRGDHISIIAVRIPRAEMPPPPAHRGF